MKEIYQSPELEIIHLGINGGDVICTSTSDPDPWGNDIFNDEAE